MYLRGLKVAKALFSEGCETLIENLLLLAENGWLGEECE
jgi:hypothetical protein